MRAHNILFSWLMRFSFFFLISHFLFAGEQKIQIINGTKKNRPQEIETLNLIRLQKGMQIIKSFDRIGPVLDLQIPEDKSGFPYMLQGIYQGIRYNHVIPPVLTSNKLITLKVYEKTNRFHNIHLKILYVVRYVGKNLRFLVLYKFMNESKYTFVEKNNGLHFFIPNQADQVNASVSVGSGLSNIQWLKINPEVQDKRKNIFAISYPLKPGERIYQIGYQIPYDGSSLSFPIQSMYPVTAQIEMLLETKGLNLRILEKPNWNPQTKTKQKTSALSGNLITLPNFSNILDVVFQAGEASKEDIPQETNTENVLILSPLSTIEKVIYPTLSVILLLTCFIYFQKKPLWLVQIWLKRKSLLEYQLNSIHDNKDLQCIELIERYNKKLLLLDKKIKGLN